MNSNKDSIFRKMLKFAEEKGFYIILGLCVLSIGISGYVLFFTEDPAQDPGAVQQPALMDPQKQQPQSTEPVTEQPDKEPDRPTSQDPDAVPEQVDGRTQVAPQPPQQTSASEAAQSVSNPVHVAEITYTMPVSGEVLRPYSGSELVYDETMGDWRTHTGIDIACAEGDSVYTIAPGQVTGVFSDGMQGNCITVKHAGGLVSTYCGLAQNGTMQVGMELQAGDAVGAAGSSMLAESAQPCHLHLEITRDGAHIDPMSILK